jgi:hypothetical protein
MPYIRQEKRKVLDEKIRAISDEVSTDGELNYVITKLLLGMDGDSYEDFQNLIGTLECAKQEFYRRKIVPYEEKKRKENGEVYR